MNKTQQARRKAQELTAEIDRMTDVAARQDLTEGVRPGAGEMVQPRWMPGSESLGTEADQSVMYERARQIGSAVISSGDVERLKVGGEKRGEILRGMAEIARDTTELEKPETTVGVESRVQRKEYRQEDLEALEHENGQGLKFEAAITRKNQEAVGQEYAGQVEKMMQQPVVRLADLVRTYRAGVNDAMAVFNRTIGGRN